MALLCVALLSMSSSAQSDNLSLLCGKYQKKDPKMVDRCVETSRGLELEKAIFDKAVMGYLCCLGYDCLSNAYNNNNLINYLGYADFNYIYKIVMYVSNDLQTPEEQFRWISMFAEHLDKCGRQVANKEGRPGCVGAKGFTKLTSDDFSSFMQSGKCSP